MSVRPRVSIRTCVACGNKATKQHLVRIVLTVKSDILIDPTGKKQGRGAYVCKDRMCNDGMLKKGRLEYVLRTIIPNDDWERLAIAIRSAVGSDEV